MNPQNGLSGQPLRIEVSKRQRRRVGCCAFFIILILFVSIVGGIGIGILAFAAPNILNSFMSGITGIQTVQTQPVQGDPAAFDPIAAFDSILAFAGEDALLVEFEAMFVRSDGTLDLTATYNPSPRVSIEFLREVPAPADAPPVGAGGFGTWYEPIIIDIYRPGDQRRVSETSGNTRTTYTYVNEGMTRDSRDPQTDDPTILEPPTCPFADLWARALDEGARADAVAVISYSDEGYEFFIRDLNFRLNFDTRCRVTE